MARNADGIAPMYEQATRSTRIYYARAMDRAGETNIRADDAAVQDILARAGFEIANPFRAKPEEPVDALALVEENRKILSGSSLMVANLSVPGYPYVGVWFEIADASTLGLPVAAWVGSSGYECHHYLNAYCEFIVQDVHSVVEYLQRAHTRAGVVSQLAEAKAYYDVIAARYDEKNRQCYPPGGDRVHDAERAGLAETLTEWCQGKSVLELGCGTGEWTASLLRCARTVRCVDASSAMIEEARARVASAAFAPEFEMRDFFDAQLRFDGVQVVVGLFLLGFLPRLAQQQLLRRIREECDPGTIVILGESIRHTNTRARGLGSVRLQCREVDGRPFVICKEVFSTRALATRALAAGLDVLDERQPALWFSCCVAQVPQ